MCMSKAGCDPRRSDSGAGVIHEVFVRGVQEFPSFSPLENRP